MAFGVFVVSKSLLKKANYLVVWKSLFYLCGVERRNEEM